MRKIFLIALTCMLAIAIAMAFADPALAATKKKKGGGKGGRKGPRVNPEVQFQQALNRLDPQTRLEQVCDREAMKRLKEEKKLAVDRAQGSASAEAKTDGHKLTSTGGAYRIKSGWHGLTYVCQASPDHTKVLSFEYQTGDAIPKAKWEDYGLWN
jgi:Domain of Unknown Function (DUF930)